MSLIHQSAFQADKARAPVVGTVEHWPPASQVEPHTHTRHQLMYASRGVTHVMTEAGRWILPPTRAIWIGAGVAHAFQAKHPVEATILYIDGRARGAPPWQGCKVVNVSALVRALIASCAGLSWDYRPQSREGRLAHVLLEQLEALPQAPLDLPEPLDPRALRIAAWLKAHPADRTPLAVLASRAGASVATMERLFTAQTRMPFSAWRLRLRMIVALEQLAQGDAVGNVACAAGYGSPSSFIAAFRAMFGTTPARYFDTP